MINKIRKFSVYFISVIISFLMLSNISNAAKLSGCCDKHNYKDKASYVFQYSDNQAIDVNSELKDLEKLMLKDKNLHIKIFAFANAADEEISTEKFKKALDNAVAIKKHLASVGVDASRVLVHIKVFIGGNKESKDSIRIYESRHKS